VGWGAQQKNLGIVRICYGMFKATTRGGEEKDQSGEELVWEKGEKEGIKGASCV